MHEEIPYKVVNQARKDDKDTEAFEIADNKPIELECQKIYETFKDKLQIIHNH